MHKQIYIYHASVFWQVVCTTDRGTPGYARSPTNRARDTAVEWHSIIQMTVRDTAVEWHSIIQMTQRQVRRVAAHACYVEILVLK